MSCQSKLCSWISAISQLAVAAVIVYAGLIVGSHMNSWTKSFTQGSEDLHSIRIDMDNISYSMDSIKRDMNIMKFQTGKIIIIADRLDKSMNNMNIQLFNMNNNVSGIEDKFSPQGMFRSFMSF